MSNRGKTFLQEIRDAIDWADRLLLVAGLRAFTSDYVRDEWQYAYETYKGINIVLRLGDYADFPAQLSGFDAPDFRNGSDYDERLTTLKRQLAEPIAPIGAFHSVPALPPYFLNRPEALNALRELVIADVDKPTLISAEKRKTIVEGMGGIGKSVLAAAFAHDRKVRFAFPDGIVWLTAGRDAKMYELYRAVGVALGDDLSNYPDEATARQNAQNALVGKKCLLILDDVWELPVGRAFRDLISGTLTRLLITTRNLQINDLLNANEYRLTLIDKSQAADYLRSWVGEDPKLDEIAEKLGCLFLALNLAGRLMRENSLTGDGFLSMFERVSDMEISPEREDSLEISINLSVDAAFANHGDRKFLYHGFGIFQEDTDIPQQTILQLWSHMRPDIRPIDHLKTLTTLVNLGLVERDEQKIITLHDLLHSYTREKLGDRYVQTHQALLDSYGIEKWDELPLEEPYLWRHFGYHLVEAERAETLRNLLLDFKYLQAKLISTDPNAIITDCHYFQYDPTILLLKSTMTMSSHVLFEYPDQLCHQLRGRLWSHRMDPHLASLWQATTGKAPIELIETQSYPPMEQAGGWLIRELKAHEIWVLCVKELSDGRLITWSRFNDNILRLWGRDGTSQGTLVGHENKIGGVIELFDHQLLSWSADHTLRLWGRNGTLHGTLVGHEDEILGAIEFSDHRLLSWSADHTLRLWGRDGTLHGTLVGHDRAVLGAMELPGMHILSWSEDATIRIWDTNGRPKSVLSFSLETWVDEVNAIASENGRIAVWSFLHVQERFISSYIILDGSGTPIINTMYPGRIIGVSAISDGHFVSYGDDGILRFWTQDGDLDSEFKTDLHSIYGVYELKDGRILAWGSSSRFELWSRDGTVEVIGLATFGLSIRGVVVLKSGNLILWQDKIIYYWNTINSGGFKLGAHEDFIENAIELSDGRVVSWDQAGWLYFWTTELVQQGDIQKEHLSRQLVQEVKGLATLSDGRILSWAGSTLSIWTFEGNEEIMLLDRSMWGIDQARELTDGKILVWKDDPFPTLRLSETYESRMMHKTFWLWNVDGTFYGEVEKDEVDSVINNIRSQDPYFDQTRHLTPFGLLHRRGNILRLYRPDTKAEWIFVNDASINAIAVLIDRRVIAFGDSKGGIVFLSISPDIQQDFPFSRWV